MRSEEETIYLCIGCPLGCDLKVTRTEDGWVVNGAQCERGTEYALQEHLDPRRVLTMVVSVVGGTAPVVPARTTGPIPRAKLLEAARFTRQTTVGAPVNTSQVLVADIANTGVDLVATGSVPSA